MEIKCHILSESFHAEDSCNKTFEDSFDCATHLCGVYEILKALLLFNALILIQVAFMSNKNLMWVLSNNMFSF